MNNHDQHSGTNDLVESVLALVATPRGDPHYRDKALSVLELCEMVLKAQTAYAAVPCSTNDSRLGDLGSRIAELRASGCGVRAIARHIGVHASTVSRRLRRARNT